MLQFSTGQPFSLGPNGSPELDRLGEIRMALLDARLLTDTTAEPGMSVPDLRAAGQMQLTSTRQPDTVTQLGWSLRWSAAAKRPLPPQQEIRSARRRLRCRRSTPPRPPS